MKYSLKFLWVLVCACWVVVLSNIAHAETATVADDANEVMVAREILQKSQPVQQPTSQPTASSTAPQVANDLAEGQFQRDLPTMNTPVIDQANILDQAQKQQLSDKILKLYQEGKAQIGVVIVPTTGQEDIFSYAMRVAETWQLGSAKRDNGLLIAIAINDRRIQILTGYGLEGVLPDIITSRIIRDQITPYFKQGQYAEGVSAGLVEIERILNLDPEIATQAANELRERQEQALKAENARQSTMKTALIILIVGAIASMFVGQKLSASTAAVAGVAAGLVNGMGIIASLFIGVGIFILLITSIAQLLLQSVLSGSGRGGGSGGGFGGGGFSGGGGGFGGGGASGSW